MQVRDTQGVSTIEERKTTAIGQALGPQVSPGGAGPGVRGDSPPQPRRVPLAGRAANQWRQSEPHNFTAASPEARPGARHGRDAPGPPLSCRRLAPGSGRPPARDAGTSHGARPTRPCAPCPTVSPPPPPRSSRAGTGVRAQSPQPPRRSPAPAASYLRPPRPRLRGPRAAVHAAAAASPPASAPAAAPPPSWLRSEVTSGGAGSCLGGPQRPRPCVRRPRERAPTVLGLWDRRRTPTSVLVGPDAPRPSRRRAPARRLSQGLADSTGGASERKPPRPGPPIAADSLRTPGLEFRGIKVYYENPQPLIKSGGRRKMGSSLSPCQVNTQTPFFALLRRFSLASTKKIELQDSSCSFVNLHIRHERVFTARPPSASHSSGCSCDTTRHWPRPYGTRTI